MEAINRNIVDPLNRTIQVSRGQTISIEKAVDEGKFPRNLGAILRRSDPLSFADALAKGLIDVSSQEFQDPVTGTKISIQQAVDQVC